MVGSSSSGPCARIVKEGARWYFQSPTAETKGTCTTEALKEISTSIVLVLTCVNLFFSTNRNSQQFGFSPSRVFPGPSLDRNTESHVIDIEHFNSWLKDSKDR